VYLYLCSFWSLWPGWSGLRGHRVPPASVYHQPASSSEVLLHAPCQFCARGCLVKPSGCVCLAASRTCFMHSNPPGGSVAAPACVGGFCVLPSHRLCVEGVKGWGMWCCVKLMMSVLWWLLVVSCSVGCPPFLLQFGRLDVCISAQESFLP
jgi:hypothetical protein